jgi:hypothetical protein
MSGYEGRIAASMEEFARHASAFIQFARGTTQDTVIRDQNISAGDKVVLVYCSGNRDEDVWPDVRASICSGNGSASASAAAASITASVTASRKRSSGPSSGRYSPGCLTWRSASRTS